MTQNTTVIYAVTDRNDGDRLSVIVDTFRNRSEAEKFAAEYEQDNGSCAIEEWNAAHLDQSADMNDIFNEIDARFHGRTDRLSVATNDELAAAISDDYSYDELKARFEDGGMEAIVCFA